LYYPVGSGLAGFLRSKKGWPPVTDAKALIKGWLLHCRFLSHFALSERDKALEDLEGLSALPDLPRALELEHLFDLCNLANQFSLWDRISRPLERLEQLSKETGYSLGLAQAGYFRAALLINEGKYQEAVKQYRIALDSARRAGNGDLEAEILNDIGFCHRRMGQDELGESYYVRSLRLREKTGNLPGIAESMNNLGLLCQNTKRPKEAEEFLTKALKLETTIGDKMGAGYTLVNLGYIFTEKKSRHQAEELFRRALDIRAEIGDNLGLGYCYLQLAHIAEYQGRAEELLENSHRCFSSAGDLNGQLQARMSLAEILLKSGDSARAAEIARALSGRIEACSDGPTRRRYHSLVEKCREAVPDK